MFNPNEEYAALYTYVVVMPSSDHHKPTQHQRCHRIVPQKDETCVIHCAEADQQLTLIPVSSAIFSSSSVIASCPF